MRELIKKFLLPYKAFVLVVCALGIFIDIFLFNFTSDLIILFLTGLWILSVWLYKFEGRVSVIGGLIFLSLCPFLLIFGKEALAEKSAIWAYMFLVVGVGQMVVEYARERCSDEPASDFITQGRGAVAEFTQLLEKSKKYLPLIIIVFSLFLFSPALTNFFSGDDWFHLNISQITSFKEFSNFFSFSPTPQSAAFYRPLSTQVFFFVFQSLFDLNSLPYYLFILAVFGCSLYLIYLLAQKVLKNKIQAILALFFYSVSVTNFTKIYFLSAFQEIAMVVFVLLSILSYLKKPSTKNTLIALLFFILALASKETAVVLPFILLILDWSRGKINIKRILPFIIILLPYLCFRFSYFGSVRGESYIWDFSPKRAVNTLFWYTLWSFGAPELLVDYVSSGFRILPRFYTDFPFWSSAILLTTSLTLLSFLIMFIKNIKAVDKKFLFALGVFGLGLLPVLFLPWHKFTLELTLPMVGFSMMLAKLSLGRMKKLSVVIFILLFFILNVSINILTYKTHYSVSRAKLARRIYTYFKSTYPEYPQGKYFEFINDTEAYPETWGSSKQIAHAASGSNLFKVLYKNKSIEVYYQDYEAERPKDKEEIKISSRMFLE